MFHNNSNLVYRYLTSGEGGRGGGGGNWGRVGWGYRYTVPLILRCKMWRMLIETSEKGQVFSTQYTQMFEINLITYPSKKIRCSFFKRIIRCLHRLGYVTKYRTVSTDLFCYLRFFFWFLERKRRYHFAIPCIATATTYHWIQIGEMNCTIQLYIQ